ncbi:MAG: DNA-3-methyladenine glycosylase [Thermoplasmatota archaeon]
MESKGTRLSRSFFADDADRVAARLLGCVLVHETGDGRRAGRVVETEAYFGPQASNRHLARRARDPTLRWIVEHGDPAAHSFRGKTARNAVMFGPAGFAYVYFIYGAHECMNVSTGTDGEAQAVLIRALEPVEGIDRMAAARGVREANALASGPGKLTQALGISRAMNAHDLTKPPLFFVTGESVPPRKVGRGPRVGLAAAHDLPLRFWIEGNPFVSRAKGGKRPRACATPRRSRVDATQRGT